MNVNDAPIFLMTCVATLSMIVTIGIFWAGIFALLGGRDTVWECSWRWPARLAASLRSLGEIQPIWSMRAAFARFVADEPRQQRSTRNDLRQPVMAAPRRPVSAHYMTVGARARQRTTGHGSSRRVA